MNTRFEGSNQWGKTPKIQSNQEWVESPVAIRIEHFGCVVASMPWRYYIMAADDRATSYTSFNAAIGYLVPDQFTYRTDMYGLFIHIGW